MPRHEVDPAVGQERHQSMKLDDRSQACRDPARQHISGLLIGKIGVEQFLVDSAGVEAIEPCAGERHEPTKRRQRRARREWSQPARTIGQQFVQPRIDIFLGGQTLDRTCDPAEVHGTERIARGDVEDRRVEVPEIFAEPGQLLTIGAFLQGH